MQEINSENKVDMAVDDVVVDMDQEMIREPLAIIVGPTAVGKSAIAVEVAKKLQGEIISGDSMQVYRGLNIGTAKLTTEEMQGIPHHLVDIIDPQSPYSVADFQKQATQIIQEIHQRGRLPILVGGTGLYIRSVVDPYEFQRVETDGQLRKSLQAEAQKLGNQVMHQRLLAVDPPAAARIHPQDIRRVLRALEVFILTGKPFSSFQSLTAQALPRYRAAWVGLDLDRPALYQRIEQRVDEMFAKGFIEEVAGLLAQGLDSQANSMQALGYRELALYLQGDLDLNRAVELIKQNTRRYAKRQLTWFRQDKRIRWFQPETGVNAQEMAEKICPFICRTIQLHVE